MSAQPSPSPLFARGAIRALKEERVRSLVHVPDAVLQPILDLAAAEPAFDVMNVTREEEGVGIVAGHHIGGRRSVLLLQSSGLGNALNALSSHVIPFRIPCPMIVSLRGEIGDRNVAQVPFGAGLRDILHAVGIEQVWMTSPESVEASVREVLRSAYRWGAPVAAIITRDASGGIEE